MALLLFAYLLFTPKSLKLLTQLPASKIFLDTPSYCTVHSHCNQYFKNCIYRAAVSKATWMCSRKLRQFTVYIQGTDIAETTQRGSSTELSEKDMEVPWLCFVLIQLPKTCLCQNQYFLTHTYPKQSCTGSVIPTS